MCGLRVIPSVIPVKWAASEHVDLSRCIDPSRNCISSRTLVLPKKLGRLTDDHRSLVIILARYVMPVIGISS